MTPRSAPTLCQPRGFKSCAACCGLYNFVDNDRGAVTERLRRNTRALTRAGRPDRQDIGRHSERFRAVDNGAAKRFATIFNCEFVGFLGPCGSRVGCLLHPQAAGSDLRAHSFYGMELCRGHVCLSHHHLTPAEQQLVIDCVEDWYLYGLVITDIDLVKGYCNAVANRLGETLAPRHWASAAVRQAAADFFQWKTGWPFQPRAANRFGKYLFCNEDYEEIRIPYERWRRKPSPHHRMLLALGSDFSDESQLAAAEGLIEEAIDRFVAAWEGR